MIDSNGIRYIAIEGVIGAGKTTLARKVSERLKAKLILEQFEENPFLGKFYEDRKRFAFQTQMFFLVNRFKQQQNLAQGDLFSEFTVADYIFEKDRIFAHLNLESDELKLYESIFPVLERNLRKPDLLIFLQSSVDRLMHNIRRRNRSIEASLTRGYIEELHRIYNNYFFKYNKTPILIVNSTEIDFVNNEKHFDDLFEQIFRKDRSLKEYFNPLTRGA